MLQVRHKSYQVCYQIDSIWWEEGKRGKQRGKQKGRQRWWGGGLNVIRNMHKQQWLKISTRRASPDHK